MTAQEVRQLPRVFINCPFDEHFRASFNAIVFACVHAGFYPVTADSGGQTGRPRLERILDGLSSCRYSIHDLSRCRGDGDLNIARFNMPLELGMAIAMRGARPSTGAHEYLILVPEERYLYQRFVSDLAGFDPQTHDGTQPRVIAEVLAWLLTAADAPAEVSPTEVLTKLSAYERALDELSGIWQGGTLPWPRVVEAAARVAQSHSAVLDVD